MTKITINRTFDKAPIANTDSGKELTPFIDSQLSVNELTLRTLSNGISFTDNFYGVESLVELKHNTPQVINVSKPVKGIVVGRTYEPMSAPFFWKYNDQNELEVTAQFTGSPSVAIKVNLMIHFL